MGIVDLFKRVLGLAAPEDPLELEVREMRKAARKAVKLAENAAKRSRRYREGKPEGLLKAAEELRQEHDSA